MSVEMGRKMMEMMARHVTKSDRDLASLIGGIRSIRVLKAQQPRSEEAVQFSRELLSMAADGEYALVMSRTEDGQTSEFYFIDGGNSAPSEFLMICFGPEERMALDIYGVFDVKDISRLSTLRGQ